ncbi:MAG: hypothetical protein IJD48_04070 [Clostridia bacterium]|nr:hypothetical protein [Clostridia bacterium]
MGYYRDSLSAFNANSSNSKPLSERMEIAKKAIEQDLERQIELRGDELCYLNGISPDQYDSKAAEAYFQAQARLAAISSKSPIVFFREIVANETHGLCESFEFCLEGYNSIRDKMNKIESGKGLIGSIGKGISFVREHALETLSTELSLQCDNIEIFQRAAADFNSLTDSQRLEFVVGRYENSGRICYNADDIKNYDASQSVNQNSDLGGQEEA